MSNRNPFTPTFGKNPPLLVGRDDVREQFGEALDNEPGAPGRATIYTGARGVGKTVMLSSAEDEARNRGWSVVTETATPGLARRLATEHLPALLAVFDPKGTQRRLTGVALPVNLGGVNWATTEAHEPEASLRSQMTMLTDILAGEGTGLLVTVDEIHKGELGDRQQLSTILQHLIREEKEIAFAGAGLPGTVRDLLDEDGTTFLQRADRHHLGPVALLDVAKALRVPIELSGRTIDNASLVRAVDATGGYPFMIQLVGCHVFRQHHDEAEISEDDVDAGTTAAAKRLGSLVHEPSIRGVSDVGRSFLLAMSQDNGPSKMADIATRLGESANYVGQYRLRLLDAELIVSPVRGLVDFALPYLRGYLREHAASLIANEDPTAWPGSVEEAE